MINISELIPYAGAIKCLSCRELANFISWIQKLNKPELRSNKYERLRLL